VLGLSMYGIGLKWGKPWNITNAKTKVGVHTRRKFSFTDWGNVSFQGGIYDGDAKRETRG